MGAFAGGFANAEISVINRNKLCQTKHKTTGLWGPDRAGEARGPVRHNVEKHPTQKTSLKEMRKVDPDQAKRFDNRRGNEPETPIAGDFIPCWPAAKLAPLPTAAAPGAPAQTQATTVVRIRFDRGDSDGAGDRRADGRAT